MPATNVIAAIYKKVMGVIGGSIEGQGSTCQMDANGNLRVATPSSNEVSLGRVPGQDREYKFGRVENLQIVDANAVIWDGADQSIGQNDYTFPDDAGVTLFISSDSASDTIDIKCLGLNGSFELQNETQTLAGLAKTEIGTGLVWPRMFRLENVDSVNNVGTIYVYQNTTVTLGVPDDLTMVVAVILPGNNQTLMEVYTVPANTTALITSWEGHVLRFGAGVSDKEADIEIRVRPFGGVFQIRETLGLKTTGTGAHDSAYNPPIPIAAKSDIIVRVNSLSSNGTTVGSSINMFLADDIE